MINYRNGGKRIFDFILAIFGLLLCSWIIFIAAIVASLETRSLGIFRQVRVGKDGKRFDIYKIKTMRSCSSCMSVLTTKSDRRVTQTGRLLRRLKIDELPQLFNVLLGDMSFVGPRPEVPEYADYIYQQAPSIFEIRPGVTGPATIKYRNEESILERVPDVKQFNDEVILPDKININLKYLKNFSLGTDALYIFKTFMIMLMVVK